MRRVLLVLSWPPSAPGGVTTVVLNLHDQLTQRDGWGARLLVDSWADRTHREETVNGRDISYIRVQPPYIRHRGMRAMAAFCLSFVPTALQCRRLLRQHGITVINIHFPGTEALFWTLLRKLGLFRGTVVLSFHGADVTRIRLEASGYQRFLWRMILAGTTALTACSRRLADELRELFPQASMAIHVVPNGVDERRILAESRSPRDGPIPVTAPYLISIAGFENKKGLDVLLAAFARLRQDNSQIRLLLLCRAGPDMPAINALIGELELADRVTVEVDCPHHEAMSLLRAAEALIVPSRKEPFGIVVLEAAALGRPVILTDVCGVLEWLDRSVVSIVPADDTEALAAAIAGVLSDKQAAESQAKRLNSAVAATFSWSHATTLLLRAAEQDLGAPTSSACSAGT
jgi:glycosyltransferase involved in cell wall biosynthesis